MEKKIEAARVYDVRTEDALKIIKATNEKTLARARKAGLLTVDKRYDAENGWKQTVFYNRGELEEYVSSKENKKIPSLVPTTAPTGNQPFNAETLANGLVFAINQVVSQRLPQLLGDGAAEKPKTKKTLSLVELKEKKFLTLHECAALSGLPPKAFSDLPGISLGAKKGRVISQEDFNLRVLAIKNGEFTIPTLPASVKKKDKVRQANV